MRSLEQMRQTVNNDYQQFKAYTHGKSRIESGTEEWSQLKLTKAQMKENFEALQQQGNAVVVEATAFNTYVNTNIASKLEVCEVKTYTKQFETALATLNTNLQSAKKEAVQYEAEVNRASAHYGATAAPTFNQLQEHVRNIQSKLREMDPVQRNAQRILTEFKTKTSGIERIYSCNSNWPLVSETERAIREQEQLFQAIKATIAQESSAIEQLIAGLEKDGK
jgi:DNA-binding protein YbaB